MPRPRALFASLLVPLLLAWGAAAAQQPRPQDTGMPVAPPPPLPPKPPPTGTHGNYVPILPQSDAPWGLDDDLLRALADKAEVYQAYTRRFTCTENARLAEYDAGGSVADEKSRSYGYLLVKPQGTDAIQEYRQRLSKDGEVQGAEVRDAEPFPPAYGWVFLFSREYEPYFSFRSTGDRFEGFDWVYEIQFKGSLPFTDGKDIRQWEGVALIDAVTYTPLEIHAEPAGQSERIDALYRRWAKSFNFMGLHSAPRPLAYRANVEFRLRREGLTFPTELRYDTYRAVGINRIVPTKASTRTYVDYRIFLVNQQQKVGEQVEP